MAHLTIPAQATTCGVRECIFRGLVAYLQGTKVAPLARVLLAAVRDADDATVAVMCRLMRGSLHAEGASMGEYYPELTAGDDRGGWAVLGVCWAARETVVHRRRPGLHRHGDILASATRVWCERDDAPLMDVLTAAIREIGYPPMQAAIAARLLTDDHKRGTDRVGLSYALGTASLITDT